MTARPTVTRVHISTTTGANRRPGSGDAWFSDGKSYGWLAMPEQYGGGIRFFTTRRTHEGTGRSMVGFASPSREAALAAYFA